MIRCTDKMAEIEQDDECITEHPGFTNVCLDKWVLHTAAIGLKTRNKKSYVTLYKQGGKSESEFLRSVAYRQIVRFIWNYMGNMRTPLPACIYTAIRKEFPSEHGTYTGFEEEDEEEEEEEEATEEEDLL
ncbi:hypothetical protein QZH41_009153 [Actinostola sp. cb2023]|nr:hypothetical protein QZH41_009153 [Actinostola sp. cb2023]